MSGIVITGYASLDHAVTLGGDIVYGRTVTITGRQEQDWPRLGGGPAYVATAIRRVYNGPVLPVSWIGDDALGEVYTTGLKDRGLSADGIVRLKGARTPVSILAYNTAGDCACLYDPGFSGDVTLNEPQRRQIHAADWICLTIGPAGVTAEIVDSIREDQHMAWIVKDDPQALPLTLATRVAARADVIFCNQRERSFVNEALADSGTQAAQRRRWIIETRGGQGAQFDHGDGPVFVPTIAMTVRDPTGAGDSFAGGVLAALLKRENDAERLGRSGHAAALVLLNARRMEDERKQDRQG
ncbi:carbohydrate kinase family protein [Agrobacterium vitis]|uniref:carbohydrate kinase family protein n=1 Tax=Allorhizobium ampelinum TaxID=3025782 RepID=UPI001F2B07B3|nr:PfkB family carbohydrate kinase [Allorhizobium ampelinum]MCF1464815.1 carbohydrate kinase family protein [Allorhizobium ampelinum]